MGIHSEANVPGIHLSGKITIYTILPKASTSSQHCLQVVVGFCTQADMQHNITISAFSTETPGKQRRLVSRATKREKERMNKEIPNKLIKLFCDTIV